MVALQFARTDGDRMLREANAIDKAFLASYERGHFNCVVVAAHYIRSSEEQTTLARPLDRGTIYLALQHVLRTHPALCVSARYDKRTEKAYFHLLESVNLDKVVEFTNEGSVKDALETCLGRRIVIQDKLPLWRVTVTKDDYVLFSFNHSIGDGRSGLVFHKTLFEALGLLHMNSDDLKSVPNIVHISAETRLPLPVGKLVHLPTGLHKMPLEMAKKFVARRWYRDVTWTGNKVPMKPILQSNVQIIDLSPDFLSALLSLARKQKATLTSILYSLAISLFSRLLLQQNNGMERIIISIPMCLRDYLGMPQSVMGNYFSFYVGKEPLRKDFTWDFASQFADTIRKFKKKSLANIGAWGRPGSSEKYLDSRYGSKRHHTFEISNLGAFKLVLQDGHSEAGMDALRTSRSVWSIGQMYFAQSGFEDSALFLNVVGNPMGGASICVCWETDALEQQNLTYFMENFRRELYQLVDDHSS